MELNEITVLKNLDPQKNSLDEKGSITSKPSIWYLIGRTILWLISCGHAKINPKLHAGIDKVIESTKNILKNPEQIQKAKETCDDLTASLEKLQKIQKISTHQQNELSGLITAVKDIKDKALGKVDEEKNATSKIEEQKSSNKTTTQEVNDIKSDIASLKNTLGIENTQAVDELAAERTAFVTQVANGTIPDRETFLQQAAVFYPEIELYKGVTQGTPEFKEAQIERQRTETSLLFIYWIWKHNPMVEKEGDDKAYQDFTRGQKEPILKWESFKELCKIYREKYNTIEKLDFLLTTMADHDLGKVDFIQALAKEDGVKGEHDEILLHIFKNRPNLLASFIRLPKVQQEELIIAWAWDYLGPQFMQGESVPASLTKILQAMKERPELANHFMLHDLCDLAGAMGFGQPNKEGKFENGCRTLDENTYQAWKQTCIQIQNAANEKEAYLNYLAFRAELFDRSIDEDKKLKLDVTYPEDYACVRICCMLRLFNNSDAQIIADAFIKLRFDNFMVYQKLVNELNISGLDNIKAILVYYAPTLMINVFGYTFNSAENSKIDATAEGLKILAEIYKATRKHLVGKEKDTENGVFTVNVNSIARKFLKPAKPEEALSLEALRNRKSEVAFDEETSSASIEI